MIKIFNRIRARVAENPICTRDSGQTTHTWEHGEMRDSRSFIFDFIPKENFIGLNLISFILFLAADTE